jgi:peptidoglycan-associated lipoprotein
MERKLSRESLLFVVVLLSLTLAGCASDRQARKKAEMEELQKKFAWWPTDAKPAPVKDQQRGGYWWWPTQPGQAKPWGNRGFVYVYKIIFDYKEEELPPAHPREMRPSLLIKKIIKNVKVYFDFDKADLRPDALVVLEDTLKILEKNLKANILITGNCDIRGSEKYNEKLGKRRGESVKKFMLDKGIAEERIKIVSRGKLDAIAPITDLVGMARDRNAQFMIAEVEEIMLPTPERGKVAEVSSAIPEGVKEVEEGKYVEEREETVESEVKVSTKEYTIKKGDSLWKIAEKELGSGHRWKYLYELNKDKIKNHSKLKPGQKIIIPVE